MTVSCICSVVWCAETSAPEIISTHFRLAERRVNPYNGSFVVSVRHPHTVPPGRSLLRDHHTDQNTVTRLRSLVCGQRRDVLSSGHGVYAGDSSGGQGQGRVVNRYTAASGVLALLSGCFIPSRKLLSCQKLQHMPSYLD